MRTRKTPPAADRGDVLEEVLIAVGLVLIVAALWGRVGMLALLVPGLVALWIGLPPRAPFVVKGEPASDGRTKG